MAACWLIGFEETPDQFAEICVFELNGHNIGTHSSVIGYGLHPFGDPNLEEAFFEEEFPIDVADCHTYAAEWEPGHIRFFMDKVLVRSIDQAPDYPIQLMLDL